MSNDGPVHREKGEKVQRGGDKNEGDSNTSEYQRSRSPSINFFPRMVWEK